MQLMLRIRDARHILVEQLTNERGMTRKKYSQKPRVLLSEETHRSLDLASAVYQRQMTELADAAIEHYLEHLQRETGISLPKPVELKVKTPAA